MIQVWDWAFASSRIPRRRSSGGPWASWWRSSRRRPCRRSRSSTRPSSADEPAEGAAAEPAGLADLRAALGVVAAGSARSITLCGFPDGQALLRVGRALAIEGIVVEPVIRSGGGGVDIRVRRASPDEP